VNHISPDKFLFVPSPAFGHKISPSLTGFGDKQNNQRKIEAANKQQATNKEQAAKTKQLVWFGALCPDATGRHVF
jgi:hypothetical protein